MTFPSEIIIVRWTDPKTAMGGGGAYSKSILNALKATFPGAPVTFVSRKTDGKADFKKKLTSLLAVTSKIPYRINTGFDQAVADELSTLCASSSDKLVVFDGAETFLYKPYVGRNKTYHISHNIEHQLYAERIMNNRYPVEVLATVLRERRRFEAFEMENIASCDYVSFISPNDQFHFSHRLGRRLPENTVILPSFDAPVFQPRPDPANPLRVTFLADYTWQPNVQGIQHFIDDCWSKGKGAVLQLYGKNSEAFAKPQADVRAFGWVADLNDVWKTTDVMIAPIYWGGGINIKVCEAVYQGIPLVATPSAVRGLPAMVRDQIGVISGDQDWMQAIATAARPSGEASSVFSAAHATSAIAKLFSQPSSLGIAA